MKKNIYFVFASLDTQRGGVTKSIITRANLFVECGYNVSILTYGYQPDFHKVISELLESSALDSRVNVKNFFDEKIGLAKSPRKLQRKIKTHCKRLYDKLVYNYLPKSKTEGRFYRNGKYVKFIKFRSSGFSQYIDYFNESRARARRVEYDYSYVRRKITYFDLVTNKPKLERFLDSSGRCKMTIWVNPRTSERQKTIIFSKPVKEYQSLRDAQKSWIGKVTARPGIIFCDSRRMDDLVGGVALKGLKKIAVIHSNHLKAGEDIHGELKENYSIFFDRYEYDAYVFLTERQKQDVELRFGLQGKCYLIPHAVNSEWAKGDIFRPSNKVVMVARYEPEKKIHDAIKAMKSVTASVPDATLEIYGRGSLEKELKDFVIKLGLQENVFINGYTAEPDKVFSKAKVSVLCSSFEGFGMVIGESLRSGTPVVSYDIRYGPDEIIEDGMNGRLVAYGDVSGLASAIIDILKMPSEKYKEWVLKALEVERKFSENRYSESWISLVSDDFI